MYGWILNVYCLWTRWECNEYFDGLLAEEELSDKVLRDVVMSFVIAGRDTTANVCASASVRFYAMKLQCSRRLYCLHVNSPGTQLVSFSTLWGNAFSGKNCGRNPRCPQREEPRLHRNGIQMDIWDLARAEVLGSFCDGSEFIMHTCEILLLFIKCINVYGVVDTLRYWDCILLSLGRASEWVYIHLFLLTSSHWMCSFSPCCWA